MSSSQTAVDNTLALSPDSLPSQCKVAAAPVVTRRDRSVPGCASSGASCEGKGNLPQKPAAGSPHACWDPELPPCGQSLTAEDSVSSRAQGRLPGRRRAVSQGVGHTGLKEGMGAIEANILIEFRIFPDRNW